MKKVFLLWALFTSFVTASDVREDLPSVAPIAKSTKGERIEDWDLIGDFNRIYNIGFDLNRNLRIQPLFENSMIEDIDLSGYKDSDYRISIHTIDKINTDLPFQFKQKFVTTHSSQFFIAKKQQDFPEFLEFFYQNQYLPDCIIDFIIQTMAQQGVFMDDFRLRPEKLLSSFNQFLTPDSCEQEVETFVNQKLASVTNPAQRQDLMASVIISLQEKNPGTYLIKTWAQKITDPSATPWYGQVKLIQSNIEMNDLTQPDPQMRYRQALQNLLTIPSTLVTPEIQNQINLLVKNIYNHNQLSSTPLPPALENIQVNFGSIYNMLVHMSQRTQAKEKLPQ